MEILAKARLSIFGNHEAKRKLGNLGMAMLFERRVRARGASSAATENTKDLWRPPRRKIDLSEQNDRFIKEYR